MAHFADIDTRRAIGFEPRKLAHIPSIDLHFEKFRTYNRNTSITFKKDNIWTSITHHISEYADISVLRYIKEPRCHIISDVFFSYDAPETALESPMMNFFSSMIHGPKKA